jgi:hypothetical protein
VGLWHYKAFETAYVLGIGCEDAYHAGVPSRGRQTSIRFEVTLAGLGKPPHCRLSRTKLIGASESTTPQFANTLPNVLIATLA